MKGAERHIGFMKVSVIIPSLNPDDKLIKVVDSLIEEGFEDIILVNDGSDKEHLWPFEKVAGYKQCTILTHDINRGKGRALKTAFEYCMDNRQDCAGVVTVDGDNQHKADDIYNCCVHMMESHSVVLGVRNFSSKDVPGKSRFGNNCTSFVFRVFCGLNISDTQTGLRAIPFEYIRPLHDVAGERFEYETNMLLEFKRKNIPFVETEIKTVYIDENASTHFHPIRDSFKIYKVILRYMAGQTGFKYLISSVLSWVLDNAVFNVIEFILLAMNEGWRILIATTSARVLSSAFNYSVNRKIVFHSKERAKNTAVKYYILWFFQMMISFGLVCLATDILSLSVVFTGIAKIIIDLLLFLLSYQIQKRWVFRK
ncbi:MAG: glycosyltransferase [Lachnospira sp.]